MALVEFRTLAAIIVPCSVKTNGFTGENFSLWRWSQFVTTSAFSSLVRRNIKSDGKRSEFRRMAWFRAFVVCLHFRRETRPKVRGVVRLDLGSLGLESGTSRIVILISSESHSRSSNLSSTRNSTNAASDAMFTSFPGANGRQLTGRVLGPVELCCWKPFLSLSFGFVPCQGLTPSVFFYQ